MAHSICCYTLFNVTETGVTNRARPNDANIEDWVNKRNTQCNFDTILQVISLRSQPEVVASPTRHDITDDILDKFGLIYKESSNLVKYYWKFVFEVQHASVFENGIIELGALYKDCSGVPMLLDNDTNNVTSSLLDITNEYRNIYFEEL